MEGHGAPMAAMDSCFEVVFEANRKEKIDKWSLMGRMGNKSRALVTQCAAWMRPDIIYVKRPLYQCRFEPQDEFSQSYGRYSIPSCFILIPKNGRLSWRRWNWVVMHQMKVMMMLRGSNTEIIEWMEDDASDDDNEDYVIEAGEVGEDEDEEDEEEVVMDPEETQEYWDEQWQKAT
ncbi:hypothetical protein HPP92_015860 [Vanilla planifolia]|uniref:Uncharacterized protein n=1 Tax=Vanilla planifolia TaxID=51239 RepID=A0A835QSY9_VANPL|nr:hypothetical protein HPP92_015860 [Vanilla planifolia]